MPAAAIGAAVSIYAANRQSSAARDAARSQQRGADAATAEQRRQYDQTREDFAPFREAGYGALERQEAILNGDYSGFENSPDYLYARDEMQRGVERGAAARGGLYNGGTNVDLARHLGGLASQNLNSYWAKLAGQANQSYNATSALGQLGAESANQIGGNYRHAADAQASSYMAGGRAWAGAAGAVGGAFNDWYRQNQANNPGGTGWYFGRNPGDG